MHVLIVLAVLACCVASARWVCSYEWLASRLESGILPGCLFALEQLCTLFAPVLSRPAVIRLGGYAVGNHLVQSLAMLSAHMLQLPLLLRRIKIAACF